MLECLECRLDQAGLLWLTHAHDKWLVINSELNPVLLMIMTTWNLWPSTQNQRFPSATEPHSQII